MSYMMPVLEQWCGTSNLAARMIRAASSVVVVLV